MSDENLRNFLSRSLANFQWPSNFNLNFLLSFTFTASLSYDQLHAILSTINYNLNTILILIFFFRSQLDSSNTIFLHTNICRPLSTFKSLLICVLHLFFMREYKIISRLDTLSTSTSTTWLNNERNFTKSKNKNSIVEIHRLCRCGGNFSYSYIS